MKESSSSGAGGTKLLESVVVRSVARGRHTKNYTFLVADEDGLNRLLLKGETILAAVGISGVQVSEEIRRSW